MAHCKKVVINGRELSKPRGRGVGCGDSGLFI